MALRPDPEHRSVSCSRCIRECLGPCQQGHISQPAEHTTMTAKRQPKATGITNAPLERGEAEQEKVPPKGESTIGKGRERKAPSPKTRHAKLSQKKKAA